MNTSTTEKLSFIEKAGYSLGDLAANLVFQTLVTFIAYYYTSVYRLELSTASLVIALCGFFGGVVFSPIMGIIADRTRTRWGRYRPWILWTSVPFAVAVLLAFTTPDFGYTGKVIYAFITFLMLTTLYTANNLPYASLSGVLTGNMSERNSLSSYRFVAVMVAQFIIQVLLLPLVMVLGNGDKAAGFEKIMTLFGLIAVICFVISFLVTRERVIEKKSEESKVTEDLTDLVHNKPWVVMIFVVILVFINLPLKGNSYIFYFENYADRVALAHFLDQIGFSNLIGNIKSVWPNFRWPEEASTSAFSLFNGAGILMMIVGISFTRPLADRFGKRNVFRIALFISTLFLLAFYFISREAIIWMFLSQILHGFAYGITIPLLWAMIADVADYSEWKNHRRATAIIFSAMNLGLKAGVAIGGPFLLGILGYYGYDQNATVQSEQAIYGIKLTVSVFCSIPFFAAAFLMFLYEIDKKTETVIEQELADRHRNTDVSD